MFADGRNSLRIERVATSE